MAPHSKRCSERPYLDAGAGMDADRASNQRRQRSLCSHVGAFRNRPAPPERPNAGAGDARGARTLRTPSASLAADRTRYEGGSHCRLTAPSRTHRCRAISVSVHAGQAQGSRRDESYLERILKEYASYYNEGPTDTLLDWNAPKQRARTTAGAEIRPSTVLGKLHHCYG